MPHFFVLFVPGDLDLWRLTLTVELGRNFCTMHLTAKFHRRMSNRSEVIILTNRLTNKQMRTSTSLRYAKPVGNDAPSMIIFDVNLILIHTARCDETVARCKLNALQ